MIYLLGSVFPLPPLLHVPLLLSSTVVTSSASTPPTTCATHEDRAKYGNKWDILSSKLSVTGSTYLYKVSITAETCDRAYCSFVVRVLGECLCGNQRCPLATVSPSSHRRNPPLSCTWIKPYQRRPDDTASPSRHSPLDRWIGHSPLVLSYARKVLHLGTHGKERPQACHRRSILDCSASGLRGQSHDGRRRGVDISDSRKLVFGVYPKRYYCWKAFHDLLGHMVFDCSGTVGRTS